MRKQIFVPLVIGAAIICSACVKGTVPEQTKAQTTEETVSSSAVLTGMPVRKKKRISGKDVRLIALVTMAEAEGECEEGKRLVIDTILNRVDSRYFPDTVYDVVYQPYHFSSMWNGRAERCEVREEICQMVIEELEHRVDREVMLFSSEGYSIYGEPMFQVGNHYFSSYEE